MPDPPRQSSAYRWATLAAAGVATAVFVASTLLPWAELTAASHLLLLGVLAVTYGVGAVCRRWVGAVAVAAVSAGIEIALGPNPFLLMITLGPWFVGVIVRDRRLVAEAVCARNAQLEVERQRCAEEAIRLERARIAHELHDIVAHCVSVMVVQAGAGRRLVASDPARAAAAFADIADVAGEAHVEIRKLVELLRLDPPERLDPELAPALVDLTDRVRAAGLDIRYAYTGPPGLLPAPTSSAAYRIAQESVTNAIKHAPGAPIWLSVRRDAESISIEVVNGRPRAGVADLCAAGGGHGLRGMERRVAAVAGSFGAGPGPDGSWRVWARLPTGPAVHLDEL